MLVHFQLEIPSQDCLHLIVIHLGEAELPIELQHVRVTPVDAHMNSTGAVCSKRCQQNAHQSLAHRLIGVHLILKDAARHYRWVWIENAGGTVVLEVVEPVDGVFTSLG